MLQLERRVRSEFAGVRSTVPAFNRLLIEGAPDLWDPDRIRSRLAGAVQAVLEEEEPGMPDAAPVILPVCYGSDLGPDLPALAGHRGMTPDEVSDLHATGTYVVLATGFAPGWAYLGDVDPRLEFPRHAEPRSRVPRGSVGIADRRTGVYPMDGPGGWQLIGRVPPALFADASVRIARFSVGGLVTFRPVSRADYDAEAGDPA